MYDMLLVLQSQAHMSCVTPDLKDKIECLLYVCPGFSYHTYR
jgi:hypothetical protein